MDRVLLELLHRLEEIGEEHEELFDSDVREAMDDVVFSGFVKPKPGYVLPDKFGMFSTEGDELVREVFLWFLPAALQSAEQAGLDTFHKRLAAVQNLEVRTEEENDYNDFFGWSDPALFDELGNVIQA